MGQLVRKAKANHLYELLKGFNGARGFTRYFVYSYPVKKIHDSIYFEIKFYVES